MLELCQALNRLKAIGMQGWGPEKESWLRRRLTDENVEAVTRYVRMVENSSITKSKKFTVEVVIDIAVDCAHKEHTIFVNACIGYLAGKGVSVL